MIAGSACASVKAAGLSKCGNKTRASCFLQRGGRLSPHARLWAKAAARTRPRCSRQHLQRHKSSRTALPRACASLSSFVGQPFSPASKLSPLDQRGLLYKTAGRRDGSPSLPLAAFVGRLGSRSFPRASSLRNTRFEPRPPSGPAISESGTRGPGARAQCRLKRWERIMTLEAFWTRT